MPCLYQIAYIPFMHGRQGMSCLYNTATDTPHPNPTTLLASAAICEICGKQSEI